jgi:hypothetical protein
MAKATQQLIIPSPPTRQGEPSRRSFLRMRVAGAEGKAVQS